MGLPTSVEAAIGTLYALSFGPLSRNDVVQALRISGMAMPDGSAITSPKVSPMINKLLSTGLLASSSSPPSMEPQARADVLKIAREKGWLLPLGRVLQQVSPGELSLDSWARKWDRQRFVSFEHACRDIFLALEGRDLQRFNRLVVLCDEDPAMHSVIDPLVAICARPFDPDLIERVPPTYRSALLSAILRAVTSGLVLDHPVFLYVRQLASADPQSFHGQDLGNCATYIIEREILAGDFAAARDLLKSFGHLNTSKIQGMLELLSGDLVAARTAYGEALQQTGKLKRDQIPYLSSLPGLLHALLLAQSGRVDDRRQARKWVDWMLDPSASPSYNSAYLWLDGLLERFEGTGVPAEIPRRPRYPEVSIACLGGYLMELVCRVYGGVKTTRKQVTGIATEIEPFLAACDKKGAHWPLMQLARLLCELGADVPIHGEAAEAFFLDGPAQDLSQVWEIKELWESQIGALTSLIQGAGSPEADPTTRTRRLAWKLCRQWEDSVRVVPVEQKRTKRGGWSKGREVSLHRLADYEAEGLDYLTDQDKSALHAIKAQRQGYYRGYSFFLDDAQALEKLAGHPNLFWEDNPGQPVEVVAAKPEAQIVPDGDKLRITMIPYPIAEDCKENPRIITMDSPMRLRVVTFEPLQMKMAEILGPEGIEIPQNHAEEVLPKLQGLSKHIPIQSDVEMTAAEAETVEPQCHPHLLLQRVGDGLQVEMVVVPLGQESQRTFTPGSGSQHLIELLDGRTLQTQRDLPKETTLADEALRDVPVLENTADTEYTWTFDDPFDALELLEQLQSVSPEVLTVKWPKGDPITVRSVSPGQFQFSVRSATDWFEVQGKVQVDQGLVIQMQTLLEQIESSDSRFITIGKDQYIALTREFRKRLESLVASGQSVRKGKAIRVHPLAAIGLEQWRDHAGGFEADEAFDACIERFRAVESYSAPLPSTLTASLRSYQEEGFQWLARLAEWGAGACLADDMGLGKTIEALALILLRASQGPTLVVAPTSVCANWVTEARRFAPTLKPIRFGIGDQGRRDHVLDSLQPFDLVVCSYTMLQQEAETIKNVEFATIVLDEAQAIKNAATKRSTAAMSLKAGFRMICTGTPIENRLSELWNLFRFINPGLLGSEKRFQERFIKPIEVFRDHRARSMLKALIQPFLLRRTKSQVLEELPPRTEMIRLVELSDDERVLHESLRQRALERLEGVRDMEKGRAHIQVLAELMKLRRCCCNPRLVMPNCGLPGSKLEAFAELVDELRENRHKALVFSQFVDHLTLLREHLDAQGVSYQYLDGQTPAKARQKRIDDFQQGHGDLFLISLRAGGLGLNLTAADYVIHMDPWWNPAVEDQASDRAHRIGQTRPVTVYRLVAANTIEEKIVELHHAKRDLADSLLEGTHTAHTLTANELIALLRNQ